MWNKSFWACTLSEAITCSESTALCTASPFPSPLHPRARARMVAAAQCRGHARACVRTSPRLLRCGCEPRMVALPTVSGPVARHCRNTVAMRQCMAFAQEADLTCYVQSGHWRNGPAKRRDDRLLRDPCRAAETCCPLVRPVAIVALLSQTFFLCAVALVPLVFVRITSSIGAAKPSHQSFAIITRSLGAWKLDRVVGHRNFTSRDSPQPAHWPLAGLDPRSG